ncbi:hypothetical protein M2322_002669 [Rhodoblastus acidophilus]|uniref:hypothetical protein n=1 Tax=Rhodoblastus acidophilus TaxID=1074 RepID=UPI00222495E9|nr:hypothetical protein [Rhodoblastus acidophilus]MCW2317115.1 hypothetical protein [Rhodoblastus acidophilus]
MKFYDTENPPAGKLGRIRLSLAQAFIDMLLEAYDALLHHGVNYHTLPAYKDQELLDKAATLPINQAHDSFITWMGRVKNDIRAAVRRKGFHKV